MDDSDQMVMVMNIVEFGITTIGDDFAVDFGGLVELKQ